MIADFRLGCAVDVARKGVCWVVVEFNAFAFAFVYAFVGALWTRPRVDRVSVRFAFREIMKNRLSMLAFVTSDNYIPLSGFIGECAHGDASIGGVREQKAD